MSSKAYKVFLVACGGILILGIAQTIIDGVDPWAIFGFGYLPHRLAARIIEVPRAILSLVGTVAWMVVGACWIRERLGRSNPDDDY